MEKGAEEALKDRTRVEFGLAADALCPNGSFSHDLKLPSLGAAIAPRPVRSHTAAAPTKREKNLLLSCRARIIEHEPQNQVTLSTDGACIGNPGPGGWAYVLRFGDRTCEMFGCEPRTTNNRMELRAVIEGLKALPESYAVTICTDSQSVERGTTEWLPAWKANGWRKSKNTKGSRAVLNHDLWEELDRHIGSHTVSWR